MCRAVTLLWYRLQAMVPPARLVACAVVHKPMAADVAARLNRQRPSETESHRGPVRMAHICAAAAHSRWPLRALFARNRAIYEESGFLWRCGLWQPPCVTGAQSSMKPGKDRALIVEDSRTIAAIVKHFLQLEGFEVFVAADGVAGLEAARRERPGLIVTDLNLPGMGGLDMVKALRADDRTQDISIFMLTSDASPESETLARAVGADDYIV